MHFFFSLKTSRGKEKGREEQGFDNTNTIMKKPTFGFSSSMEEVESIGSLDESSGKKSKDIDHKE